jgi:hypothetical protein
MAEHPTITKAKYTLQRVRGDGDDTRERIQEMLVELSSLNRREGELVRLIGMYEDKPVKSEETRECVLDQLADVLGLK